MKKLFSAVTLFVTLTASAVLFAGNVSSPDGRLSIDPEMCVACGCCYSVCPMDAIFLGTYDERDCYGIDQDLCVDCGACLGECPTGAVQDF